MTNINSTLISAAINDDLDAFQHALSEGADLNVNCDAVLKSPVKAICAFNYKNSPCLRSILFYTVDSDSISVLKYIHENLLDELKPVMVTEHIKQDELLNILDYAVNADSLECLNYILKNTSILEHQKSNVINNALYYDHAVSTSLLIEHGFSVKNLSSYIYNKVFLGDKTSVLPLIVSQAHFDKEAEAKHFIKAAMASKHITPTDFLKGCHDSIKTAVLEELNL